MTQAGDFHCVDKGAPSLLHIERKVRLVNVDRSEREMHDCFAIAGVLEFFLKRVGQAFYNRAIDESS